MRILSSKAAICCGCWVCVVATPAIAYVGPGPGTGLFAGIGVVGLIAALLAAVLVVCLISGGLALLYAILRRFSDDAPSARGHAARDSRKTGS